MACTGLHGANRLASNSLLEAVVFGARIATALKGSPAQAPAPRLPDTPHRCTPSAAPPERITRLRRTMSDLVGVERDAAGLRQALGIIAAIEAQGAADGRTLLNMTSAATLIAAAALLREESRGAHGRTDFPQTAAIARPSTLTLADALAIRDGCAP